MKKRIGKSEYVTYNNKSRKGVYIRTYWFDSKGKRHISIVKEKEGIGKKEARKHVLTLIRSKKRKQEWRKLRKKARKRVEQQRVEKDAGYYQREKEKTFFRLTERKRARSTSEEYQASEERIITSLKRRIGGKRIEDMTESEFRTSLRAYLPQKKNNVHDVFIEDIVNKWGSEIKA